MGRLGIAAPDVDKMELWQAAAMLGYHRDAPADPSTLPNAGTGHRPSTSSRIPSAGAHMPDPGTRALRRRMAHHRGEAPKPEPEANPQMFGFLLSQGFNPSEVTKHDEG